MGWVILIMLASIKLLLIEHVLFPTFLTSIKIFTANQNIDILSKLINAVLNICFLTLIKISTL